MELYKTLRNIPTIPLTFLTTSVLTFGKRHGRIYLTVKATSLDAPDYTGHLKIKVKLLDVE